MITFPNAKINIGLKICSKLDNGYHQIETIFYPINFCDILEIKLNNKNESRMYITGLKIDAPKENNLVYKAFQILKQKFNLPEIDIFLHKNIPSGAGLGGGSSNAAFMLKLLNDYFKLNISNKELKVFARKLGADCAFFIDNKPVFAYNLGDEFKAISELKEKLYLLLISPDIHINTAYAYSLVKPGQSSYDLKKQYSNSINNWKNKICNDFEKPIFKLHKKIKIIKEELYRNGAIYASMTGSGSTVYGIFDKKQELDLYKPMNCIWHGTL